ncbi:hypothetical protein CRG98_024762 [Punica granatum]|uniref:K+ potassium transporter integral membrane domain-containing protein n=1 Tax=Punica granatum TaxID=22663 RepID=A0A2I0JF58_PUNGR|nr:hypothetical protein CRG98_024762 [Punica granatum]
MGAWTLSTPLFGIYSIIKNYVGIFEALSPVYIVRYFMRNRKHGCHLGVPCSVLQISDISIQLPFRQSLISATFSVIKQSVVLDYFPRVKVVHTSSSNEGEVYSPEVNYILTVLCVTVILIFGEWKDVGNAFGVVVGLVMLITTVLLTLVMITIWRTPVVLVALYFTVFFVMEGVYVIAVLAKIKEGGWIPFAISIILAFIIGSQACFFYTNIQDGLTPILGHYIMNMRSLHEVMIFTTLQYLLVLKVASPERTVVKKLGLKGAHLRSMSSFELSSDPLEFEQEVSKIEEAKHQGLVHVRRKACLYVGPDCRWFNKVFPAFYEVFHSNCRSALPALGVPLQQQIEAGVLYKDLLANFLMLRLLLLGMVLEVAALHDPMETRVRPRCGGDKGAA